MRSSKRALSRRRVSSATRFAFGLFGEDGEQCRCSGERRGCRPWLLALGRGAAELHNGGEVDGLDDLIEADGGLMLHAGVGGADGSVEAVGG